MVQSARATRKRARSGARVGRELPNLGYACEDASRIIALRSLGLTTEFIRRIEQLGIDLSNLWDAQLGVTPEYVETRRVHGEHN